ncbi:MAG: ABC transporter ATP-binding protein [Thermoanaerobacterales bacterium]|jgi:ATP-binding cassette subfamily B protein|nr:ABC transporter ATP-binding protein [Thermoanaerobacterales bacterium]
MSESSESTARRNGWRLIVREAGRRRLGIAIGVVTGLAWTAAKVSTGVIVRQAVDEGIERDDMTALRNWAVVLGCVALASAVFTGLRRYMAFREARAVEASLRDRIFAHVQRLHFAFHDEVQTGQIMSRANTDLQQIQAFVVMVPLTISNFMTVLSVTVILVTIDPLLTLLALGSLPFLNLMATRFSRRLHPHVMAIQQESAELAAVVEESVAGVRVIKGLGAERVQAARLAAEADDVYRASMAAAMTRARFVPALELLPNIGFIAVLGYGGHQVLSGDLTLGALVAFNVYIGMLVWPLRMLGMIVAQAQRAVAAAERVHEVLATQPEVTDPPRPKPLPAGGGELRFRGVRFGYGRAEPVLDGFDLTVRAGESVALVGATGSGKSTIARLIPRFYDVEEGSITLDGVDVRELRLRELRRAIGIVFEDTFLFSDTIGANIAFADPDAPPEAIERAARLAGAHEFITALPEGYATRIGERGYSLSGGQRQRIAIARAILADPRVLILDDATSAVDPTKEHEIRDALAEVMRGRTTIVIAHRPATIALADRVVLIDGGRVAAEGTHQSLLGSSERYREVLASAAARHAEAVPHDAGAVVAGDGDGGPPGRPERVGGAVAGRARGGRS